MESSRIRDRKEANSVGVDIFINVGSRNSQLALIQTEQVISRLEEFYSNNPDRLKLAFPELEQSVGATTPALRFKVISMTTIGDRVLDKPLPEIGAKSLFTKELEVELVNGSVDMIVHSLKDIPTTLPNNCVIGAVLKRDSPEDVLVLKKSLIGKVEPLNLLIDCCSGDENIKIGTSSQRRIAMVKRCNPGVVCSDIRGNLNTRLAKLDQDDGQYSAIILARAGLDRMGWSERCSSLLTPDAHEGLAEWCYAVGQGAIAVECRSDDERVMKLISPLIDLTTSYEVVAERSLMRTLEGGCSMPLGVRSTWIDELTLRLEALILSVDGLNSVKESGETKLEHTSKVNHCQLSSGSQPAFGCISLAIHDSSLRSNLEKCSNLGGSVANKMIGRGCLKLIRRSE